VPDAFSLLIILCDVCGRWSANSVIGPPTVYPRYGDIHGAWAQGNTTESEFIVVCLYSLTSILTLISDFLSMAYFTIRLWLPLL